MSHSKYLSPFLISALMLTNSASFASAFQLFEYSGRDQGNFGAGGAAVAEDASTTFSNPAGLTRVPEDLVIAGSAIHTKARFKGQACGGVVFVNACTLADSNENGGTLTGVPALHYAYSPNDEFAFGLGITAPFGLATRYDRDDPIRYTATDSIIRTININPSMAYKISDNFSAGIGVDALRLDATLNAAANIDPTTFDDSSIRNKAHDWGYGWNAGILYQFPQGEYTPNTRLGISYRSHISLHLNGNSRLTGQPDTNIIPSMMAPTLVMQEGSSHFKTSLRLPETWMMSVFHQLNNDWAIMGSAIYTDWDSVKRIRLQNVSAPDIAGNASTSTIIIPEHFHNTWRYAIGADYIIQPEWRLRFGVGYDETPIQNKYRSVVLPDSDRIAVAVGMKYSPTPSFDVDLGYQHLFFKEANINTVGLAYESIGESHNRADVIGLQFTWNIDSTSPKRYI
jgi:long-chain fatty acid transport protein